MSDRLGLPPERWAYVITKPNDFADSAVSTGALGLSISANAAVMRLAEQQRGPVWLQLHYDRG